MSDIIDISISVAERDEFLEFLKIRGINTSKEPYGPNPAEPEKVERSAELTAFMMKGLSIPELEGFWKDITAAAWKLKRDGILTERNLMEVVREFEKLTDGETTEEWYEGLSKKGVK